MNPANGYPQGGGHPNGGFFQQRGAQPAAMAPPQTRPLQGASAQIGRAEKFEDDKRRIIETCFSKRDEKGNPRESYITHLRVEEDASYQSSPPPPDAPKQHKKPRVIIIAVKNTGLLQVHKARENDDGSFQVGKTWQLDELQSIQVYNPVTARTPEEQQQAQWAGSLGLSIMMAKPYYWKANAVKEKEFFVSSLVRIYKRYTKGKVPELIGFTRPEMEALVAGGPVQTGPGSRPSTGNQPAPVRQQQDSTSSPQSSVHSSTMGAVSGDPVGTPPPLRAAQQQRPFQAAPPNVDRDPRSMQQTPSPTTSYRSQPALTATSVPITHPQQQPRPLEQRLPSQQPTQSLGSAERRPTDGSTASPAYLQPIVTSHLSPSAPTSMISPMSPSEISPGTHSISSMTTQRWRPGNATDVPSRQATDSPEHSPGSVSPAAPSPLSTATQIVPERRRPPLQETATAESVRSFRQEPAATQPPPLATQSRRDPNSEPLPEVRPLRTSGTYTSPQKPKPAPMIVVQQEPDQVPTPVSDDQSFPTPAVTPSAEPLQASKSQEDKQYRPGLGPMMGRQGSSDVASKFRKAATAYTAFKPRAGGAGERLLGTKAVPNNEADGVTRVMPAPLSRSATQDVVPSANKQANGVDKPVRALSSQTEQHTDGANDGPVPRPQSPTGPAQPALNIPSLEVNGKEAPRKVSRTITPKPKKQTDFFAKSLASMDIDTGVVNNQHLEYENILSDFNWDTNLLQVKQIDVLKNNLRRDISRLEAGSWLGDSEHKDDRVAEVETLLDRAIAECDEMEGLLTLYSVELNTLNEDVAYIEAQSQGLQVQTANQKLLHNELQNLIATISLDASQLEPLRRAPLGDLQGLEAIEGALTMLYKALQTIDPTLLGKDISGTHGRKDEQALSNMKALQEKRSLYLQEAQEFLARLRSYAEPTFAMAFQKAKENLGRNSTSSRTSQQDVTAHDLARGSLWPLRPLMVFAEEIDRRAWEDIIAIYVTQARNTYQTELSEMVAQWKKGTRRSGGEEQDALFTAQEKEGDGLTGTARRLTVKRSQTLARITRSAAADKRAAINRNQENKQPFEAFTGALEETVPLIFTEQNFIVDFFYSHSLESADFAEVVSTSRPNERRGTNLLAPRRLIENNRAMSQKLLGLMEGLFPTYPNELQSLMAWAMEADPFQGIGILCALERKRLELEDTNQEFLVRHINKIYERLSISFNQFVDSQVRAIEETKVKINKRKGVIAFIKVFPNFSVIVENMLPPGDGPERLETRTMVDEAYNKIIRSMFDSLKTIAKAAPVSAPGLTADPEDKEALNHHILLIENMFHFYNELDEHGDQVLGQWRGKAVMEMSEHQELYVNAIIRRPLGKLLDFLDSAENLIGRGVAPSSIPSTHPSHSRSVYKKILSAYDAKEVRRGIDTLKKRIEKHFGEADDAAISTELIKRINAECERKYNDVQERATRIAGEMFEGTVQVDFTKQDVSQAFRR